jgi:hypothetical protein
VAFSVPEFEVRLPPRLIRRQPHALEVGRAHLDVPLELFARFGLERVAAKEAAKEGADAGDQRSASQYPTSIIRP